MTLWPVMVVNGWITVSWPIETSASMNVLFGSVIVTPLVIKPSRILWRITRSAWASCRRSLMPRISSPSSTRTVWTLALIRRTMSVK